MKAIRTIMIIAPLLFNSCGFNKMFLFPYKLTPDSTFKDFDEDKKDSLRMSFDSGFQPHFNYDSGSSYNPGYTIESLILMSENDSLNAWIISPDSSNGNCIYFLHGNAGNLVYQYQLMVPFVERGYRVFMIDYSGFGFSQGKTKRTNVLKNAFAGMDYLLAHPDIKGEKLIVYGQSLGGHLALSMATIYRSEIDALVTEGAFSSHKDIANDRVKLLGRIFVKELYSAKDSIQHLTIPKLIIHSAEDETIPFAHGEKLYELAAEPKTFYIIDQAHIRGPLYYADSISLHIDKMIRK